MNRILLTITLLALLVPLARANQAAHGFCETGAQVVVTSGLTSTTQVQASFPSCTVTVFVHGGGLATIFSDNNNTPLSNPFTAQTNGQWTWYAANGRYDVQMSGAGFPSPMTISDILLNDSGGGGGGGGAPPLGNNGDLQMKNGTLFAASHINDSGTLISTTLDEMFKGPNPYVDVRAYGGVGVPLRSVAINGTPVLAGITATMTAGQNTVTVSTSSCPSQTGNICFQNGEGVTVYGAGLTNTLSTPAAPTVTPSLAAGAMNASDLVNAPTGATTYNYKVVLRDKPGGLTAPSAAGTTTTGQATLGSPKVNVTSLTRTNNSVAVVTASPINLSVGATIYVTQSTDASFSGVQKVATVTDTTHFTYLQGMDTRGGATASATGGTVQAYSANKITTPAYPTNGWQYYICSDRASPGTFVPIGVTKPLDTVFEDYGSPYMDGVTLPDYVANACTGSGTNDPLSTTIVSGGGTTTLTLASNASNSTPVGATIKLDHGPNLLAALAANPGGFPIYIPSSFNLVINSYTNISSNVDIWQAGLVTLFETLANNSGLNWNAENGPASGPSFGTFPYRTVDVRTANPGFYSLSGGSMRFFGVNFQVSKQGTGIVLDDNAGSNAGFNQSFEWCAFTVNPSGDGLDYMGMGLIIRGDSLNFMYRTKFGVSMPLVPGASLTPLLLSREDLVGGNPAGSVYLTDSAFENRAMAMDSYPTGFAYVLIRFQNVYGTGLRMPFIILSAPQGGTVNLDGIQLDTSTMPYLTNLVHGSPSSSVSVKIKAYNIPSGEAGGGPGMLSGLPFASVTSNFAGIGSIGQNTNVMDDSGNFYSNHVFVNNPGGSVGFQMATPGAPVSLTLSSGGNVAAGTYTYALTAIDINGNETTTGQRATVTVPGTCPGSGTCTVTITPPTAPVGSSQYRAYRSNGGGFGQVASGAANWGTNIVDSFGFVNGGPPTPAAYQSSFTSAGTETNLLQYTPVLFANLGTSGNGTTVFCLDCVSPSNPCVGSGTGAIAQRLNGAWACGTASQPTATTGAILLSTACGASANCFQVFADGQYGTTATWTGGGVVGSVTPTVITTNDNDSGAEWANVTTATANFGASINQGSVRSNSGGMAAFKVSGTLTAGSCFGLNNQGGSATTVAVSVTPTGGSGHILIAFARAGTFVSSIAFSDNSGSNTWNNLTNTLSYSVSGGPYSELGYVSNVSSGTYTVTATFSASVASRSIFACEFSGLATSNVLDASAPGIEYQSSTLAYAGTLSTTGNDLIFLATTTGAVGLTYTAGTVGITQTITSGSGDPPFKAGDVGKKMLLMANCDASNGFVSCQSYLPPASIVGFIDAHNVQVSGITQVSSPAFVFGFGGYLVWGHDDASQYQAAFAQTLTTVGATLFLPCGMSLLSAQPFNVPNATFPQYSPNIIGCGSGATNATILVPTLDFNFSGANGALIFYNNNVNELNSNPSVQGPFFYGRLADFMVWGAGLNSNGSNPATLPVFFARLYELSDVNLTGWLWQQANIDLTCASCRAEHVQLWSGPTGGISVQGASGPQGEPSSITDSFVFLQNGIALNITSYKLYTKNNTFNVGGSSCTAADYGVSVTGAGTHWTSYEDQISGLEASNGESFLNGTTQGDTGICLGFLNVTGGTVGIQNTSGWTNVNMTSGSILDQGFNRTTVLTTPWTQAGTFSITGGTVIGSDSSSQTAQTSGNWSVPAGSGAGQWGTSPSVGSCSGFNQIQTCTITVGSGTVGANPILTITQPNKFAIAPQCDARMIGGTATFSNFTTGTATVSSVPFTYNGTPAASSTIVLKVSCGLS